mmetsp:Transcript_97446/g.275639  ORF Transcript_97446/g.275639 Transcript_97446/m.275639 type:complete len:607 (+) Transcript_97446:73-1893(+)
MSGPGLGYEILGAVKVKDGLFVGDELAAQDLEFVVSNKVTRVINCCGRQVPNHWEPIGVVYLTYYWVDADNQIILDQRDVVANEVFRFVEEALEGAESVLIHSVRGQSRSCCVLAACMMKKYSWGLRKTMEFLSSRRPDLNLKPAFLQQLSGYERRLMSQARGPFSLDWNEADFSRLECEELLLRNTYINSQMGPLAEFHSNDNAVSGKPRKLVWLDNNANDKLRLEKPAGADRHNLQNGKLAQPGQLVLKCIIKKQKGPNIGGARESHPVPQPPLQHGIASRVGAPSQVVNATGPGLMNSHLDSVPTAWAAEGEGGIALQHSYASTSVAGPNVMPDDYGRPVMGVGYGGFSQDHHPVAPAPPQATSSSVLLQRGPATNIRDSLSGLPSRRESTDSVSNSRPGSRDPSPKTNSRRSGDSPLRMLSRSGTGRAPSPGNAQPSYRNSGMVVNPGSVNLGFNLGSIRAGNPGGTHGGMGPGAAPQRGMAAFRSGEPVRAKADLAGVDAIRRTGRPTTAPTTRTSSTSRPSSPLGQQRPGSGSRPPSPQTRPPSPNPPPKPSLSQGPGYPLASLEAKSRHRSLSSHMRRAPSPTPAFNRNPSPSRPRWRM